MQPRDLSAHVAYEAGRGIEEVARDLGVDPADLTKLASNENPHGASPAAVEAIQATAPGVASYPKAAHADLRDALAERWDCEPAQVWLANGGDGALDYVARATLDPGNAVLVPDPGFAYYAMSARYHHGEVRTYELERPDLELTAETVLSDYDGERVVYLTSPHNPTGGTFSPADVERIADGTDGETLVLVDEAYGEYAETGSVRPMLDERDDVALLRTFSKAYGLAGIRLGYALVPEAWADAYARVNTPFAASELACRAGLAALSDDEHVELSVETARWAREYMRAEIDGPVWPSEGNFVLVDVSEARGPESASAVADEMQRAGVIVRDCTSFGLPGCVRVTCGTEDGTRKAVAALNGVLDA